ncbi:decaprenyl-phosphate phosphoribosyltransferase [Fulvivirga sp. RKSG066]|uniref:decaprenyl-phosphate phosphoribosyltransferase n=1 Tax=Fulvivirga aurantia TaxID=2529383 RepID=UPI0012BC727F|nr:decaprenyl-phosphate phosphoribosyltransferase [Fulvivirga aurantia]MTI20657.1 decaprenyl-phosphate phosphoribosyltransferase [Fulvivirga aurantia]
MVSAIKLIRPQQWVKNLFLLIPIFFAGEILNQEFLLPIILGIVAFSLVASSIYVINDIQDIEADRQHPKKKYRPLASGQISKTTGYIIFVLLAIPGLLLGAYLDINYLYILLFYFFLNIGYSAGLKRISILDMLIVSAGFVLRTVSGGVIVDVAISHWLLIMIFLLSLFLAIAKRRDDVLVMLESGVSVRKSTKNYNLYFIDSALTMVSGIIVVAYLMYTISPEVQERIDFSYLYATSIFVITGLMRYLQITLVEKNSSSPVRVLYTDPFIQATLGLWVISFFIILYI